MPPEAYFLTRPVIRKVMRCNEVHRSPYWRSRVGDLVLLRAKLPQVVRRQEKEEMAVQCYCTPLEVLDGEWVVDLQDVRPIFEKFLLPCSEQRLYDIALFVAQELIRREF